MLIEREIIDVKWDDARANRADSKVKTEPRSIARVALVLSLLRWGMTETDCWFVLLKKKGRGILMLIDGLDLLKVTSLAIYTKTVWSKGRIRQGPDSRSP